jgi:predicted dehydrogenase
MTRVLIASGSATWGSHALAHHTHPGAEIVGLVNRSTVDLPDELAGLPRSTSFDRPWPTKPDLVVIATYTDSHADYACRGDGGGRACLRREAAGHERADAERRVVAGAERTGRKLVVGYILRHHPSWMRLIEEARALGGPYVFRLNLNQQSFGRRVGDAQGADADHLAHRRLRRALRRRDVPDHRREAGARARHGPAALRRDRARHVQLRPVPGGLRRRLGRLVRGRLGADDVGDRVLREGRRLARTAPSRSPTATRAPRPISTATPASARCWSTGSDGDRRVDLPDEPGHQALCDAEQAFVIDAIETDADLSRHMRDALQSLRICLAADRSIRTGRAVDL